MLRNFVKVVGIAAMLLTGGMAQAQEALQKVRLAHSTDSFAFIVFFAADAMDYFREAGVDAEIIRAGSGAKTVAAVVGGSADVAIGATSSGLYARKEGIDMKMFALMVGQYSSSIIYSKDWAERHGITADSSFEDKLAALRGITIATSGPGAGEHIIRYIVARAGLDVDRDVTITHLGNEGATMLAALEQGRIDAIALSPPTTHIAIKDQGAVMAFNTAAGEVDELDGYPYIVASARDSWLQANPDAARKVVSALQMALDAMHDPERTNAVRDAVHAKYYPDVDPELFATIWIEASESAALTAEIPEEKLAMVIDFVNRFEEEKLDPAIMAESYTNEYFTE